MEISNHIFEEAKTLLQKNVSLTLPFRMPAAPEFYLAKGDDVSIIAFGAFLHAGSEYKIGPQKAS